MTREKLHPSRHQKCPLQNSPQPVPCLRRAKGSAIKGHAIDAVDAVDMIESPSAGHFVGDIVDPVP